MPQASPQQMPGPAYAGPGQQPEPATLARRLGYEDGLVAVGVPPAEAARRAAQRYP